MTNYAAVAQVAQVSRSRVTQMTALLNLAPDIQEEILFLPAAEAQPLRISEPALRKLTATLLWNTVWLFKATEDGLAVTLVLVPTNPFTQSARRL